MNNPYYVKSGCYLIPENGFLLLYTPSGELIAGQIESHTSDSCEHVATCTATFTVNICTKDEMIADIKRKKIEEINKS